MAPRGGYDVSVHFSESEIGTQRRNCFVLGLSDPRGPGCSLNSLFTRSQAGVGLCHLKAPALDLAS